MSVTKKTGLVMGRDGIRPHPLDVIGVAVMLAGMAIIMFAQRCCCFCQSSELHKSIVLSKIVVSDHFVMPIKGIAMRVSQTAKTANLNANTLRTQR